MWRAVPSALLSWVIVIRFACEASREEPEPQQRNTTPSLFLSSQCSFITALTVGGFGPSWTTVRRRHLTGSEFNSGERRVREGKKGKEQAIMGSSHFLFHPLGRTCLRLEECLVFTFPPSHSSSPHTLSTNTHCCLASPRPPLSRSLMGQFKLSRQTCNVIPLHNIPPPPSTIRCPLPLSGALCPWPGATRIKHDPLHVNIHCE